jgi:hypothetical protein
MGAKHPARNPAKCLASYPRNVPAMAGQWQQQCRRTSVKTTRKTTCLAPDLDAQCPRRKLARQLATWPRNSRAKHLASSSWEFRRQLLTMTSKNYEHTQPSPPTPDLESLRKAIQEYQPDPRRIPFNNLKPFHDSIVELRGKNASYAAIAELLNNMGSRPAGRVWPNTAASSWKAANRASGGNGRKPRQPQISRPRLKVRQPWPQNPRRPRRRQRLSRAMSRRHQKKILHTVHADRTLPT